MGNRGKIPRVGGNYIKISINMWHRSNRPFNSASLDIGVSTHNKMGSSQSTPTPKMEATSSSMTSEPSPTKMSFDLPEQERTPVGKQEEVLRLRGGYIGYLYWVLNVDFFSCNCSEGCCGCSCWV